MTGTSNWHSLGAGTMSAAGRYVSLSLVRQSFGFSYCGGAGGCSSGLRSSGAPPGSIYFLVATHTDLAAGLGFLSEGQRAFSPIVFAGGAVIAAEVHNTIAYQGASLSSAKFPMIAYGVLATLFLIVPLLVILPVLLKVKRKGLLEYGAQVTIHNQLFDRSGFRRSGVQARRFWGTPTRHRWLISGAVSRWSDKCDLYQSTNQLLSLWQYRLHYP